MFSIMWVLINIFMLEVNVDFSELSINKIVLVIRLYLCFSWNESQLLNNVLIVVLSIILLMIYFCSWLVSMKWLVIKGSVLVIMLIFRLNNSFVIVVEIEINIFICCVL